mmetsp:Transcript_3805/g.7417  ORF Transcript_3805/g.7417 Transcript_3805/m.7417 type:complete len:247 (-) Transcript_3805:63-803(-)
MTTQFDAVESIDGLLSIFRVGEANQAEVALGVDVGPIDGPDLAEVVLELSPRGVGIQVANVELKLLVGLVEATAAAPGTLLAVGAADSRDVDGDHLVGILRVDRRFVLDGAPLGEGLEAILRLLLDVSVVNEQIRADLRLLARWGDEADAPMVQPLGHGSCLPAHDAPKHLQVSLTLLYAWTSVSRRFPQSESQVRSNASRRQVGQGREGGDMRRTARLCGRTLKNIRRVKIRRKCAEGPSARARQ